MSSEAEVGHAVFHNGRRNTIIEISPFNVCMCVCVSVRFYARVHSLSTCERTTDMFTSSCTVANHIIVNVSAVFTDRMFVYVTQHMLH